MRAHGSSPRGVRTLEARRERLRGYALATAGRRLAIAVFAREPARPAIAAALAAVISSRPDASEKLIATSLPTPSASSTPAVALTFATAPPEVSGITAAAALRQSTHSAVVGEKAKPSALKSSVLPAARVVQHANR